MVRNAIPKSPLDAERRRVAWHWIPPLIAVAFGLMTVLEGGTLLFGGEEARRTAGSHVPFVRGSPARFLREEPSISRRMLAVGGIDLAGARLLRAEGAL